MTPLVIIPARAGSKGVPGKNFRLLPDGSTLLSRAVQLGAEIGDVWVTTDCATPIIDVNVLLRPTKLAQDDTPMSAVVEDALARVPGPDDQPIVLLQPTVPLRTVEQVTRCLREELDFGPGVATVRAIPREYWRSARIRDTSCDLRCVAVPVRRQEADMRVIFSGTAYVCLRKYAWPSSFYALLETDEPYINVDSESDWDRLCALLVPATAK